MCAVDERCRYGRGVRIPKYPMFLRLEYPVSGFPSGQSGLGEVGRGVVSFLSPEFIRMRAREKRKSSDGFIFPSLLIAERPPMGMRILSGTILCLAFAAPHAQKVDSSLSFFITGTAIGKGANLGGLAGADAHCAALAAKVGSTRKVWRAYLSTQAASGARAVNARDRIGTGPWFNAKRVMVASSVDNLHSTKNNLGPRLSLTETGDTIPWSGAASRHDMLTGSDSDGTAFAPGGDSTCGNWTSDQDPGGAQVGHYNKAGGGDHPTSWNSAHLSYGCSNAKLVSSNCGGYFYCFAADAPTGMGRTDQRREDRKEERRIGEYFVAGGSAGAGTERTFHFELKEAGDVEVEVMSVQGRVVATLAKGKLQVGSHEVHWNGTTEHGAAAPVGAYVVRLRVEGY